MAYIYAIMRRHVLKGYVGCTGKTSKRWREHRCLLRQGKHASHSLQMEWNEFGESNFAMVVLEELPKDAPVSFKRERELHHMRELEKIGLLYNDKIISFSGTPESLKKAVAMAHDSPGNRWTPEANLKRRMAQLGKPITAEHRAKISATKQAKRAMR